MSRLVLAVVIVALPEFAWPGVAQEKPGMFAIVYDPPPMAPANVNERGLCSDAPSKGGKIVDTEKTLRELLGNDAAILRIRYYSPKEWKNFDEVKTHLQEMLSAKPRSIFQYEPWAGGVNRKSIVGVIEYRNQKKGEFQTFGAHLCYQGPDGVHWWARLPGVFGPLLLK